MILLLVVIRKYNNAKNSNNNSWPILLCRYVSCMHLDEERKSLLTIIDITASSHNSRFWVFDHLVKHDPKNERLKCERNLEGVSKLSGLA